MDDILEFYRIRKVEQEKSSSSIFSETDIEPISFINEYYVNSTENDLNGILAEFFKSINKNKHESKELVRAHFNKFVECRNVIEGIYKDLIEKGMLNNEYQTKSLKELLKNLHSKFHSVEFIQKYKEDEEKIKRKELYKKYESLFKLKENLQRTLKNEEYEEYVEIYEEAKLIFKNVENSKFMKKIMEDTKKERIEFLDKISK